jgi:hypothetical protein
MNRTPYDALENMDWSKITKWEELDFVKALPDDIKQHLKTLPPVAEVEYEFCPLSMPKPVPRLNPERSRAYWLKHYNKEFAPFREKNAHTAVIQSQVDFYRTVERSLAHISETLERMNQHMLRVAEHTDEVLSICQQITEDRVRI